MWAPPLLGAPPAVVILQYEGGRSSWRERPLWLDTPVCVALHSCTYVDTHLYVDSCESEREATTRKIKNSHILQGLDFLVKTASFAKSWLERPGLCVCSRK